VKRGKAEPHVTEPAVPVHRLAALASENTLPETLWFLHYVCLLQCGIPGSMRYHEQKKRLKKCFNICLCFLGKRLLHMYESALSSFIKKRKNLIGHSTHT